jgi:membrane-associated protease RseP (regulator of RpoE activity)
MTKHTLILIPVLSASALATAIGQAFCPRGPGVALGITTYHCESCVTSYDAAGLATYSFRVEPTVIAADSTRGLRGGDVLVAVDGKLITTREGAELFARPVPGSITLRVRRDGRPVDVAVRVEDSCASIGYGGRGVPAGARGGGFGAGGPPSTYGGMGAGAAGAARGAAVGRAGGGGAGAAATATARGGRGRGGGRATSPTPLPPVAIGTDTTRRGSSADDRPPGATLGFALSCEQTCTSLRAPDGLLYWKYDVPPRVTAVEANTPADRSGLRVGDQVETVEGRSVLDIRAARALTTVVDGDKLTLGIVRGTERLTIEVRRPRSGLTLTRDTTRSE